VPVVVSAPPSLHQTASSSAVSLGALATPTIFGERWQRQNAAAGNAAPTHPVDRSGIEPESDAVPHAAFSAVEPSTALANITMR